MEEIPTIHHFVHVGWERYEIPELEAALASRVSEIAERIANGANELVAFVDLPPLGFE